MNDRAGINPKTRQRILEMARETGYIPNTAAKNLKISSTRTVAVIMQGTTSALLNQVLDAIQSHLSQAGLDVYPVHVMDQDADLETIVRLMSERRLAGLVFLGRYGEKTAPEDARIRDYLDSMELPVIFCTTKEPSGNAPHNPSISVDDQLGARRLTRHLLDLGHRRIAFGPASPNEPLESDHAWALRYQGYRQALLDAEVTPQPDWLIPSGDPDDIYTMENAYNSVDQWLRRSGGRPPVTAIVASCDATGIGTIRALHDHGLSVPGDVSVTGFDGLDFGRFSVPTLTTVVQPTAEIALETSQVLIAALSDQSPGPLRRWISGHLLVGESTAPIQA